MKNKIFIAIDTNSVKKANLIIKQTKIRKLKIGYKFGLEFINSKNGRNFISKLRNKIIFIDLKLHDIPNTISSTLNSLKDLRIDYLTVHISSGFKALKKIKKISKKVKIVGVTTLTSLDNKDLKEIGYEKSLEDLIITQCKLAKKANLDGIVCSPREVKLVRKIFKREIITPGIRISSGPNDQKRIMSPKEALKQGSDWIVIGRELTKGSIKNNLRRLIDHLSL